MSDKVLWEPGRLPAPRTEEQTRVNHKATSRPHPRPQPGSPRPPGPLFSGRACGAKLRSPDHRLFPDGPGLPPTGPSRPRRRCGAVPRAEARPSRCPAPPQRSPRDAAAGHGEGCSAGSRLPSARSAVGAGGVIPRKPPSHPRRQQTLRGTTGPWPPTGGHPPPSPAPSPPAPSLPSARHRPRSPPAPAAPTPGREREHRPTRAPQHWGAPRRRCR